MVVHVHVHIMTRLVPKVAGGVGGNTCTCTYDKTCTQLAVRVCVVRM